MQPCARCGWDTRSGSRICAACRIAEANARSARGADPNTEKEALLSAVLRSARSADPVVDDDDVAARERSVGVAGTAGDPEERHVAVLDRGPGDEAEQEHVALREIQPGEDDYLTPHEEVAATDADDVTVARSDHDQFGVATSLVEALDDSEHTIRRADPLAPPVVGEGDTNGMPSTEIGKDTADDLAALFNAPSPWFRDPTPTGEFPAPVQEEGDRETPGGRAPQQEEDDRETAGGRAPQQEESDQEAAGGTGSRHDEPDVAPPTPTYDTADDLAALFNAPSPWDRDFTVGSEPLTRTQGEPDTDYDAAAYDRPIRDVADPAMADLEQEPIASWDTDSTNATYSPAEWPWASKSGDSGFWAPPTDRSQTVIGGHRQTWTEGPGARPHDRSAHDIADEAVTTRHGSSTPEARQPDAKAGTGARLRALFQELGAWTAVAQVALLAVGMLCIIQVFVLIVVNSYLSEARARGGDVATGSLAAHAKVDGVMLPTLLAFAIVAFVFAAWRNAASRTADSGRPSGILGNPLGLPIALWRVLLAAIALLLVILPAAPPTVAAAQRITQWAIFACALLGTACFAAPRGLAVSPNMAKDDGVSRRQRSGAPDGVPSRTGSSSPA